MEKVTPQDVACAVALSKAYLASHLSEYAFSNVCYLTTDPGPAVDANAFASEDALTASVKGFLSQVVPPAATPAERQWINVEMLGRLPGVDCVGNSVLVKEGLLAAASAEARKSGDWNGALKILRGLRLVASARHLPDRRDDSQPLFHCVLAVEFGVRFSEPVPGVMPVEELLVGSLMIDAGMNKAEPLVCFHVNGPVPNVPEWRGHVNTSGVSREKPSYENTYDAESKTWTVSMTSGKYYYSLAREPYSAEDMFEQITLPNLLREPKKLHIERTAPETQPGSLPDYSEAGSYRANLEDATHVAKKKQQLTRAGKRAVGVFIALTDSLVHCRNGTHPDLPAWRKPSKKIAGLVKQ